MNDRQAAIPNRLQGFITFYWAELAALVAFVVCAYLVSSSFFPNLREIGAWDEASYINAGRLRFEGAWASIADNPLVSLLYAILYLPYAHSEFWLIQTTSAGRIVLFTLAWLSAYAVARQLARWAHPLVMIGLLFVSSIPLGLLIFPSDPLFVSMAGFSLWKLLSFHNTGRLRDLAGSSLFMGLAALSRNDGLVMGPVLVFLGIVIAVGRVLIWKALLASAAPFSVVVFGYLLVYGGITGDYRLGTNERAYDNFEAGQLTVFQPVGPLEDTLEAKLEARRLFGTPEENGYSIFRAILRNPGAYLQRLARTVSQLPRQVLDAYGLRAAPLLVLLAARGVWELLRRKDRRLLLVFLLWPAHLASGLAITLFRQGHLRFAFIAVYALAAIGLTALVANRASRLERWAWIALVGLLLVGSTQLTAPAVQMGAVLFGAVLVVTFWIWPGGGGAKDRALLPGLGALFLGVGLILHGDYSGPGHRILGENPDEQAIVFLQENFAPGTPVAAGSRGRSTPPG